MKNDSKSGSGNRLVLAAAVAMLGASLGVSAKAAPAATNAENAPATTVLIPKGKVAAGANQGKFAPSASSQGKQAPGVVRQGKHDFGSANQGKFKADDDHSGERTGYDPASRQGKQLAPKSVRQGKIKAGNTTAMGQ
jgi:hypothetical protein